MEQIVNKEALDNRALRISPVGIRMADGSIRIMNQAELLPLYYLIPEEILSKCGVELNRIERILCVLFVDPVAMDIVESNLFKLCIMDCYSYMAWFYLCPDIPFKEIYSVNEPSWRLAQAVHIWINEIYNLDLIPTFKECCLRVTFIADASSFTVIFGSVATILSAASTRSFISASFLSSFHRLFHRLFQKGDEYHRSRLNIPSPSSYSLM